MMSEMASKLRARKVMAEAEMNSQANEGQATDVPAEPVCLKPPVTKTKAPPSTDSVRKLTGSESPSLGRRRFGGNTPAEVTQSPQDLETLKQELLTEMRQELQKVKDEIIQAILSELSKK